VRIKGIFFLGIFLLLANSARAGFEEWCYPPDVVDDLASLDDPLVNRAIVAMVGGDSKLAHDLVAQIVSASPKNASIRQLHSIILLQLDRNQEAEDEAIAAIKLDDKRPCSFMLRGVARMHLGKREKMESDFLAAVKLETRYIILARKLGRRKNLDSLDALPADAKAALDSILLPGGNSVNPDLDPHEDELTADDESHDVFWKIGNFFGRINFTFYRNYFLIAGFIFLGLFGVSRFREKKKRVEADNKYDDDADDEYGNDKADDVFELKKKDSPKVGDLEDWADGYERVKKISSDSSGEVWIGRDKGLERKVILKFIKSKKYEILDPKSRSILLKEARALARIAHPGVVDVFTVNESPSGIVLVLEHLEGRSLSKRIDLEGSVPLGECSKIFGDVCQALAYLHDQGLVHRDVRPSNIFLCRGGHTKLMDFKVVQHLDPSLLERALGGDFRTAWTRSPSGKHSYRPKEASLGVVSPAYDLYSIAGALYESLTGRPFISKSHAVEDSIDKERLLDAVGKDAFPLILSLFVDALEPDYKRRMRSPLEFEKRLNAAART